MAITQSLSAKGNIKKSTNNDIPFSPAQPVVSSYYATSTASQTVINLSFSVLTTGALSGVDAFWLFVDGKKLDLGSTNDYTFTNVQSDGTSSQVTLNQSLASGLNIQAFKLGLKPEVQFGMDNRFVNLYANQNSGFQGWISQTDNIMTPTSTTGSPTAGTFWTSITGRASMNDLSKDLKPRMGIERIMSLASYPIFTEFGPNGENVYGALNDTFGQIRFVGNWVNQDNVSGVRTEQATINDGSFFEVVMYGTGLNLLILERDTTNFQYSVDGGSNIGVTGTSSTNAILESRNYSPNQVLHVVSGLTLGVHTIKISQAASAANLLRIYGVEILNESSSVNVTPGVGYSAGQKVSSVSSSSFLYSSPGSGTKGGRVIVYQNSSGTIGESFTACASSPSFLSSADHTNEEIIRVYQPTEFGASRVSANDDFSTVTNSAANRAFTLDDGTTSFWGINAFTTTAVGRVDAAVTNSANNYLNFTFVGTGLDIEVIGSGGGTFSSVFVDGTNVGSITPFSTTIFTTSKVVSGLPYGTHTVKFLAAGITAGISKFIVYQPKTPSVPSGAILLADYNLMANYVADASGSANFSMSQGVLQKACSREILYTGTWGSGLVVSPIDVTGFHATSATTSDAVQYTFFGTGVEIFARGGTGTVSLQVSIDGSLYTGSATSLGGGSWTPGTSTWVTTTNPNNSLQISGLTLGTHTIKFVLTASAANTLCFSGFNIITPIYATKSNLYADLQSTLPVGSNAISDDRAITPVKNPLPSTKAWGQAIGFTSGPTTTSTILVPVPDMTVTVKTSGGALKASYSIGLHTNSAGAGCNTQVYVDGLPVGTLKGSNPTVANDVVMQSDIVKIPVGAGTHIVQLFFSTSTGTMTATNDYRTLLVEET